MSSGNIDTVSALAQQGDIDINVILNGSTAIMIAAGQCNLAMVRTLLSLGANPHFATGAAGHVSEDAFSTAWSAEVDQSDSSGYAVLGELIKGLSILPETVPTLELDEYLYLGIFMASDLDKIPQD